VTEPTDIHVGRLPSSCWSSRWAWRSSAVTTVTDRCQEAARTAVGEARAHNDDDDPPTGPRDGAAEGTTHLHPLVRLVVCDAMRASLSLVPPADRDVAPGWAVRLQELSERELQLLAYATGEHVPIEVRFNLEQLRAERAQLERMAADDS
jgi:hypothetical protein